MTNKAQALEVPMLEYRVQAKRIDADGSAVNCKNADLLVDTSLGGRSDAFNPAELFLASIAACMLKGIERVAPMVRFALRDVEISLSATRQDVPPRIVSVTYDIQIDSDESDQRLELLHTNIRKYGTIFNTVADAVRLTGTLSRRPKASPSQAPQSPVQ